MIRLISAGCLILLIACNQTREAPAGAAMGDAAPDPADEAAVREIGSAWFTAYSAGDANGVAALYADDAVVSVPGVAPVRGSAAIREALAKDIVNARAGGVTLTPAPKSEVGTSGDLAWEWNTFTAEDKSGATVDAGKYVTVFQRNDGKWRIIRDIWNSDNPPPQPTAPGSTN